ncbi:hypothetical protein O3G_MSEX009130, partial [Manduca sexta]
TFLQGYNNLNDSEKPVADNVMTKFKEISIEEKGLGRTDIITHNIDTGTTEPIRQRYYRMSPEKQRIVTEQVDEMLSLDVIEPCESPWSSPVLVVGKKDGKPRFCLDSRKLNSVTRKDAYCLPYVSEILDNLRDAKYLSSIDLSKAFWQIPIKKEDREKTAFYVPGRGTFQFKVTAFGLSNAPATQQRLVDKLFGPEFELKVFAYLDDIFIVSKTFEEHVSLLLRVLLKLQSSNLTVNLSKCQFFRTQLRYLGYLVDAQGLRTDPEKVEVILQYPTPTNRKEVKRFLGTTSWYRRFIPQFSTIAAPLNKLTSSKKNTPPFQWSDAAEKAFVQLKSLLVNAPVLICPDFNYPFEVHTDASNFGVGGMLSQTIDGVEHPVAYMSRSLSGPERNYSVTERETLAVLIALEHWRCYLDNGKPFTVYTDHAAIKWFLSLTNPTGRLARWGVRLSAFNFDIKHRRGKDNVIPDSLSRLPTLAAISNFPSALVTQDSWYRNIFHGSQESPTKYPNYRVENGRLYRLMKSRNTLTSEFDWKLVVPEEERLGILKANHAEPTSVSTFVNDDHRSWDVNLSKIQFAMNNSVNETTGYTPSFLVHGRELVTDGFHYIDNAIPNEITFLPRDVYAENLGTLAKVFDTVQFALWQSYLKNSQRYNLRRKCAEFEVGDVVWKRCYFQSDKDARFSKKLAPKYCNRRQKLPRNIPSNSQKLREHLCLYFSEQMVRTPDDTTLSNRPEVALP